MPSMRLFIHDLECLDVLAMLLSFFSVFIIYTTLSPLFLIIAFIHIHFNAILSSVKIFSTHRAAY